MNPFPSILVPLDGSATAARSLGCAVWLAARLNARLHLLSATESALPAREALARLKVPQAYWPHIVLHQAPEHPPDAILEAAATYGAALIIMTARGENTEAQTEGADPLKIVGHVTRAVIERSPAPVLLMPPAYREALPWERILVPISGEAEGDEALTMAMRLAAVLDLAVHVAHVSDGEAEEGLAAAARYADAPYHEYPRQLEEFVSRAFPHCSPDECRRIKEIALCRGDVVAELLNLIGQKRVSLLVIGWRGRFMTGHARVLKQLIQVITCPVLLVKPAARAPFKLKVGNEIE